MSHYGPPAGAGGKPVSKSHYGPSSSAHAVSFNDIKTFKLTRNLVFYERMQEKTATLCHMAGTVRIRSRHRQSTVRRNLVSHFPPKLVFTLTSNLNSLNLWTKKEAPWRQHSQEKGK